MCVHFIASRRASTLDGTLSLARNNFHSPSSALFASSTKLSISSGKLALVLLRVCVACCRHELVLGFFIARVVSHARARRAQLDAGRELRAVCVPLRTRPRLDLTDVADSADRPELTDYNASLCPGTSSTWCRAVRVAPRPSFQRNHAARLSARSLKAALSAVAPLPQCSRLARACSRRAQTSRHKSCRHARRRPRSLRRLLRAVVLSQRHIATH